MIDDTTVTFTSINPIPKGYLQITSEFKLAVYKKKPNWFHLLMYRLLLGWKWEEYKG